MTVVVAHCRAGFEAEAAADLARVAAHAGSAIDTDSPTGRGYVVGRPQVFDARRWPRALEAAPPVFVRALFFGSGPHALFDPATTRGRPDRVAPLVALVAELRHDCRLPGVAHANRDHAAFAELRVEMPDTNDGKMLSGVCRGIELPLAGELLAAGALDELDAEDSHSALPALHVFFVDGAQAYLGVSASPWGSPFAMGIPRLHLPRGAPSRSTLKLAEAIGTFMGDRAGDLLHAGMKAVDLGAAPGGWTWQLAQRGLRVTAVDNGPLKGAVAQDPLVTHLRVDGLSYLPRRPVDWMVCDIVDQPSRVAALVARWIGEGHARRSIFNLKLPMKKRYDEMLRCRLIIDDTLSRTRARHRLQLRQLYHDREEITGFVERIE
jgi:23S rRNA (cytidine2498-2'-O)-methyltransferase